MADAKVPVAFYTDGRGTEFAPSQLRPGCAVAILYAQQHGFLDFTTGIRQEEYRGIKFLPAALDELLRLSDRVHQYSTELDGKRIYHGCDKKKTSLQKCAKCSLFWYCNKSCQANGWNGRGHKRDCKLVRDNDVHAMFLMDWDHFEDFVKFPLHDTAKSEAISPEADEADPAICGDDYSAGTGVDAMKTAGDNKQGKEGNYSLELEDLLKDIDFNSTTDSGPTHQIEDLKNWPLEGKTPEKEHKHSDADQKARELEGIQRRIERQAAREKAMARAKEAMHKMTNSAEPSASGPEKDFPNDPTKQQGSQKTGAAGDSTLVQRCIQSAIPSIAATTGTDILETINLDLLNEHFDLNIDLSDAWQRLLKPGAIAENIKAYLEECATDPYAWNILKREGHFKLNLWRVTRAYGEDGNRRNTNREYLIAILETLRKILEKDVEWEIVPDRVPRAVMRMAIAVAKEGPNPPGIDVGDEDFQIGSSEPVTCT